MLGLLKEVGEDAREDGEGEGEVLGSASPGSSEYPCGLTLGLLGGVDAESSVATVAASVLNIFVVDDLSFFV